MADTLTIAELADRSGMTARNIRAYQSRGLLHSPEIRGRVAHYNGSHLARLQLIGSLQREGFTLAAVKRLIESPGDYSAIVADRRRRFREGSSDISHTVLVGVGRMLAAQGVSLDVVSSLQLEAARTAAELGAKLREHLEGDVRTGDGEKRRITDLARVAVQLSATAYEIAFLQAATRPARRASGRRRRAPCGSPAGRRRRATPGRSR